MHIIYIYIYIYIVIKTGDTNVVLLTIVYCNRVIPHDVNSFFVEFGRGGKTHYDVIEVFLSLGETRSMALPFFHAFTGSDTTSSLFNHGKRASWDL